MLCRMGHRHTKRLDTNQPQRQSRCGCTWQHHNQL